MQKALCLKNDHAMQQAGMALSAPERINPLKRWVPVIASCLLFCSMTLASASDVSEQKKQKRAEIEWLGGKNKPGKLQFLEGDTKKGITITINGINANSQSVSALHKAAQSRGEATYAFIWDDLSRSLKHSASDLAQSLHQIALDNPQTKITINAYSMGARMAAVGISQLEKTGALKKTDINLNLISPPLNGYSSANMSWLGTTVLPFLRSATDMGTDSEFQKEIEAISFKSVKVQIYGGEADLIAPPDKQWQHIATQMAKGKAPNILKEMTHHSALQAAARILVHEQLAPNNQTLELEANTKPAQQKSVNLPPAFEGPLKALYKQYGNAPTQNALMAFHRDTDIEAQKKDAAAFLIEYKKIDPQGLEGESLRFQADLEIEAAWKATAYSIPWEREQEIRKALSLLSQGGKVLFVGEPAENQSIDQHKERLAVARYLVPDYDPFGGKQAIEESLKAKVQTTTKPSNLGIPTKDILILGEKHHDSKNALLYPELLSALHGKGFRALSLELPENLQREPLDSLRKTLRKTGSSIERDILKDSYIKKFGLSKEWIDLYCQAKELGWEIRFSDSPSHEIFEDLAIYENAKETLSKGHVLTQKQAQRVQRGKDNLAGLPRDVWVQLNELENSHIEKRSRHIALNLTKIEGKVLHVGGALHTSEVQDAFAKTTGKRPLGMQIDYLCEKKNPEEEKMQKHLKLNQRDAKSSTHCLNIPHVPLLALKLLHKVLPLGVALEQKPIAASQKIPQKISQTL